jgi:hypothetical protein
MFSYLSHKRHDVVIGDMNMSSLNRRVKNKFDMTKDEYELLLTVGCEICGAHPNDAVMVVDHDHETGRVRGCLCQSCNWRMGLVEKETWNAPSKEKWFQDACIYLVRSEVDYKKTIFRQA